VNIILPNIASGPEDNYNNHIDGSLMEDSGDVLFDADLMRSLQDFKSRALDHWVKTC
jgi:hypothetical protein